MRVAEAMGAVVALAAGAASVGAPGREASAFWPHWSDGRAELSGYRLTQPRYGALRSGTAVLVFVTEEFSDSARVKADPGRHAADDVYPVLKLNAIREFQTGIYDYNVMTSVFARPMAGWPVAKVSFSSQEWCGHVYHQLLPRAGRIAGMRHSYFDGEADGTEDLPVPADGVLEDALPILVRGLLGPWLEPGASRTVPLLPTLLETRLDHRPLAWGTATVRRSGKPETVTTPAGRFAAWAWTVEGEGRPTRTIWVEDAAPFRIVRWSSSDGEDALLTGTRRLPYWELNGPRGEVHLRDLGIRPQTPAVVR